MNQYLAEKYDNCLKDGVTKNIPDSMRTVKKDGFDFDIFSDNSVHMDDGEKYMWFINLEEAMIYGAGIDYTSE